MGLLHSTQVQNKSYSYTYLSQELLLIAVTEFAPPLSYLNLCLSPLFVFYFSLRGLNKGQKKEIYFCNKAKIFSSIQTAYTDACTSSCKIVVASKRPLIYTFCTLLILHIPHSPHSSFTVRISTLLIFHTPDFPHSALRTPRQFHLTFDFKHSTYAEPGFVKNGTF